MKLYKVLTYPQFRSFIDKKIYYGSSKEINKKYICAAYLCQLDTIIRNNFSNQECVVAVIDSSKLNNVKIEYSKKFGMDFPHIYEPLRYETIHSFIKK